MKKKAPEERYIYIKYIRDLIQSSSGAIYKKKTFLKKQNAMSFITNEMTFSAVKSMFLYVLKK